MKGGHTPSIVRVAPPLLQPGPDRKDHGRIMEAYGRRAVRRSKLSWTGFDPKPTFKMG
jgi:hypothetical protein